MILMLISLHFEQTTLLGYHGSGIELTLGRLPLHGLILFTSHDPGDHW